MMEAYKQGEFVRLKERQINGSDKAMFLGMTGIHAWVAMEDDRRWQTFHCSPKDIVGPWREPLKAEFECEWMKDPNVIWPISVEKETYGYFSRHLEPFVGKKTKVTIEEVL